MFNAYKYAKMLEDIGYSKEEAETHMRVLVDVMNENFITKDDWKIGRQEIDHRFDQINQHFDNLGLKLDNLKLEMTVRLGIMMVGAIGLCATLVKLL